MFRRAPKWVLLSRIIAVVSLLAFRLSFPIGQMKYESGATYLYTNTSSICENRRTSQREYISSSLTSLER
jgi:hypothetical protein